MKKLLALAVLLGINFNNAFSQGNFFIGDKIYPCSKELILQEGTMTGRKLSIRIIKNNKKAFLAVKSAAMTSGLSNGKGGKIEGKMLLYLDNQTIIVLIDRGAFDKVNGVYTTIYNLTESEVKKLCETNISSVRYGQIPFGSQQPEAFTLNNEIHKSNSFFTYDGDTPDTPKVDFPLEFNNLYKN